MPAYIVFSSSSDASFVVCFHIYVTLNILYCATDALNRTVLGALQSDESK
jgi:hypothetical protein